MAGCRGSNNTIPVCSMGTNRLCMPVSFPPSDKSDKTSIGEDIVVSRAGGFHVPVPHPAQERKFHILELQRDSCALAWASGNPDWVICPPSSISPGTEGVWLSGWQGQSLSLCPHSSPSSELVKVSLHLTQMESRAVCWQQQGQWVSIRWQLQQMPCLRPFVFLC